MSDIKTINADEAYQMVQENKCNLIDIRELNELELTLSKFLIEISLFFSFIIN